MVEKTITVLSSRGSVMDGETENTASNLNEPRVKLPMKRL
jgi:hypothetical protein